MMVCVHRTAILVALLCIAAVLAADTKEEKKVTKEKTDSKQTSEVKTKVVIKEQSDEKDRKEDTKSKASRSTKDVQSPASTSAQARVLNLNARRTPTAFGISGPSGPSGYGQAFQPEALDLTGFFGPQFVVSKDAHALALDAIFKQYAGQYQSMHAQQAQPGDIRNYPSSTAAPITQNRQPVVFRQQPQPPTPRRPTSSSQIAYNPVFVAQKQPFSGAKQPSSSSYSSIRQQQSGQSGSPYPSLYQHQQQSNQLQPTPTPYAFISPQPPQPRPVPTPYSFVLPGQRNPTAAEYESVYEKSPEPTKPTPVRPSPPDYNQIIYGHMQSHVLNKQPGSPVLPGSSFLTQQQYFKQLAAQQATSQPHVPQPVQATRHPVVQTAYYVPPNQQPQTPVNPNVYYSQQGPGRPSGAGGTGQAVYYVPQTPSKQPSGPAAVDPSAYYAQQGQQQPANVPALPPLPGNPQVDINAVLKSQVLPQIQGGQGIQLLDLSEFYGAAGAPQGQGGQAQAGHQQTPVRGGPSAPSTYFQVSQAGMQNAITPVQLNTLVQQLHQYVPQQGSPQIQYVDQNGQPIQFTPPGQQGQQIQYVPPSGPHMSQGGQSIQHHVTQGGQQVQHVHHHMPQGYRIPPNGQYPTISPASPADVAYFQQQLQHQLQGQPQQNSVAPTLSPEQLAAFYKEHGVQPPPKQGQVKDQSAEDPSQYVVATSGFQTGQSGGSPTGPQGASITAVYIPGSQPEVASHVDAQSSQEQVEGGDEDDSSSGSSSRTPSATLAALSTYFAQNHKSVNPTVSSPSVTLQKLSPGYFASTAVPQSSRNRLRQRSSTTAAPPPSSTAAVVVEPEPVIKPSKVRQLVKKPHSYGPGYSFEIVG